MNSAKTNWRSVMVRFYGLFAALIWVCVSFDSRAATTNIVRIGDFFFTPTNLTINVGDTIIWSNTVNNAHDSTSANLTWVSPLLSRFATFSYKFTNAGFYPYFCATHINFAPQQTGTVTVVAVANVAPTVTVTNPPNGATLAAPASFSLQAIASDSDGTVSQVEFFRGTTSLGIDNASPFSVPVSGLSAGNYTFSAIATDNLGAKSTNAISLSITNPPPTPVMLASPAFNSGNVNFSFATENGRSYSVDFIGVLGQTNWQNLTNFTGTGSSATVSDALSRSNRFYRVGAQ